MLLNTISQDYSEFQKGKNALCLIEDAFTS